MIPVALIDPGPNDRQVFDPDALVELAASIAAHGLAQPPLLRPVGDRFEIVAGERRIRAMRDVLRWTEIPAEVRALDEEAASSLMLAENTGRADLNPVEEAHAYSSRMERFGWSLARVAEAAGVSTTQVSMRLALLKLIPEVSALVATGHLTFTWAWEMTFLDPNRQRLALTALTAGDLSYPALRALCLRLRAEQDQEAMFDSDSFLRVEEYVLDAKANGRQGAVGLLRSTLARIIEAYDDGGVGLALALDDARRLVA